MALIGPSRVVLMGDESAEGFAKRLGLGFIHARDLARQVATGPVPSSAKTKLAEEGIVKAEELKAYFQQQAPGITVEVRQTGSDFDAMLMSFFFHKEGTQPIGWLWCMKIPTAVLADLETNKIIEHLELHHWKERLPQAVHGTVFIANARGFDVRKPNSTGPSPEIK